MLFSRRTLLIKALTEPLPLGVITIPPLSDPVPPLPPASLDAIPGATSGIFGYGDVPFRKGRRSTIGGDNREIVHTAVDPGRGDISRLDARFAGPGAAETHLGGL